MKQILMGDEAVGLGAIHAGIKTACGYPGTPSTEIYEYILRHVETTPNTNIHAKWSANEKVAYEEALGASFAGCRSIVTMKHVGLNVAADPFVNSAVTGVNGGLILAVADDPSMHSSQNEQDSRYYAHFALIPCLEPSNQQECYDMTREGYELSERFGIPVMLRMVTRLAHSRSSVIPKEPQPQIKKNTSNDFSQWTLLPSNARKRYKKLLALQKELGEYSEQSIFNQLVLNENKKIGVITTGIAFNYLQEYLQEQKDSVSYLKIGVYPPPILKIRKLFEYVETVLVMEEGYPLLEEALRGILPNSYKILGRLDGTLPRDGELSPDIVRKAFGKEVHSHSDLPNFELPPRPPMLCKGCPHADLYQALMQVMQEHPEGRVFSDIGCYTLGALPPYNMGTTCVDMGASISMAKGASDCGIGPCVAVIGDSTFCHSGMTPLVGAVRENSNIKVIILDNATVAMTGGQTTMTTGETMDKILVGIGVESNHLRELSPFPKNHEQNVAILKEELAYQGLSVLVCRRECIQTAKRKVATKKE